MHAPTVIKDAETSPCLYDMVRKTHEKVHQSLQALELSLEGSNGCFHCGDRSPEFALLSHRVRCVVNLRRGSGQVEF
jgi:hypothetical protein